MTGSEFLLTFQLHLDICMDSLLKRSTSEITDLVRSRFARVQGEIVAKEAENRRLSAKLRVLQRQLEQLSADQSLRVGEIQRSEKSPGAEEEEDCLLNFQMHLNSCMNCILKDVANEITAWVKDNVTREDEIQGATEQRFNVNRDSGDRGNKTVAHSFVEGHSAGGLEQDKADVDVRQVPEAACFVVAESSLGYELTVATTTFEGRPHDRQQEEKGGTALSGSIPEQHSYTDVWEAEGIEGRSLQTQQDALEDSIPFQEDPGAGSGQAEDTHHSCSQCGRSFSKQWVLRRHMRRHSGGGAGKEGEAGHICTHCGRGFKHRKGLQSHLRCHSGERPYSCDVCGRRFARPESASKHRLLHSGVKPHACPLCARRFSRSDGLRSHMRTHDPAGRPRPAAPPPKLCMCAHCGKAFANVTQVANHERTHTGERPYECPQCHKRFRHAGALSVHRVTHQRERPHACPQCAKAFRCAKHLKRHLVTHSDARPFPCDQCPLAFRTGAELKGHKARHGLQRTHACPDCGKSFKTEYEVKLHRRAHSGERPYPCPECGRTFRRLHHLTSHRLTHTGERPYACDLCQRRFLRAREMRSHRKRVHLATEPSRCDRCRLDFENLPLLEAHRRAHHGPAGGPHLDLQGLGKFPRILPRQASADQPGKVPPAGQEAGSVLSPVVFVLAGQGVPLPVLSPVTTVVTVPLTAHSQVKVQIPPATKMPAGASPAKAALMARCLAKPPGVGSADLMETSTADAARRGARERTDALTVPGTAGAKGGRRASAKRHA